MYLIDTNIWLERLLDQEQATEVGLFLSRVTTDQLAITDFTVHSIGIILTRLNHGEAFLQFVDDVFTNGGVTLLSVQPQHLRHVLQAMRRFGLDFDDAYQYVAAELTDAQVISFDEHFDRTDRKPQTPREALAQGGMS